MKWIVLSILVFVGAYTFITLYFRKPGEAYRPYRDSKERATVQRLESAGYVRVAATAERPADVQRVASTLGAQLATVQPALGGLTRELTETFPESPLLPQRITSVKAPHDGNALRPYSILFTCALPDRKAVLADTYVCLKENEIAIVSTFEPISGGLLSRSRESPVLLTLQPGTLKPGTYRATLVGSQGSQQWTFQVH